MARLSFRCLSIFTFCLWLGNAEKDFQFENGSNDDLQVMLTEPQEEIENPTALPKSTYFKELSECPYAESKLMLSLILKSNDWDDIVDNKKTRALNKLSKFFAVPKEFIKIESVSRRDIYEMSKRSIKHGINKCDSEKSLGKIEFMIGCGQSYFKIGEPISIQITQQMQDGSIDDITGLEFGWWVIWQKKITNRVQRFKREEEEGSGQIDEDYSYNDDYDDQTITDTPVETTHAHRHHHGLSKPNYLDSDKKLTDSTSLPIDSNAIETNIKHKKNELKPVPETNNNNNSNSDHGGGDVSRTAKESDITKTIENNNNQMETIKNDKQHINKIATNEPASVVDDDKEKMEDNAETNVDDYIVEDVVETTTTTTTAATTDIPIVIVSTTPVLIATTIKETVPPVTSSTITTTQASTISQTIFATNQTKTFTQSVVSTTLPTKNENDSDNPITSSTVRTATTEIIGNEEEARTIIPAAETTMTVELTTPKITTTQAPTTTPTTTTTTSTTTTTTITPAPVTEYIEPVPTNSPPLIKNRLPKQPVTAGKPFSFIVPAETFYDNEDGTNLQLELFDKNGNELKSNSWIQFVPDTKEIYGLPLEDSVSRWQYKLVAYDSKNASVNETLDITVQQHKGHRSVNHEITIQVKLNTKFRANIDWQIRLIRGIVETLDDVSMSNVVVREIRQNQLDPHTATLIYSNETLSRDKCPEEKLDELVQRLDPRKLSDSLLPEISVKSVTGQPIGPCQKLPIVKPKPTPHMTKNFPPVPRNQVDRVNATINHLLVFKVPYDTFYDPEDHTDLKLSLLTMDRRPLDSRHWLQFDSKNQEFYGIPKFGDFGSEEYLLVAEDHEGLTASDALVVVVSHPSKREYSILSKLTLGLPYETLNNSLMQRRLLERIAQVFGDQTTSNIQLKAIHHLNSTGNVLISFYNTTAHKSRCASDEDVEAVRNIWLHSESVVRERVRKTLGSEFNLLKVDIVPTLCHVSIDNIPQDHIVPTKTEEKKTSSFTDDYLFTFIVPAVIILVMLLLASIIACVLHRRRLTGKMELGDEEERRSFRSKGIPVIFQDELDEKPEIGNKSPIILKDEKPPLLPPSYNSDNDVDEYVPPPAVMMGGREQRGKSPVTPSYRKPPPYVSP